MKQEPGLEVEKQASVKIWPLTWSQLTKFDKRVFTTFPQQQVLWRDPGTQWLGPTQSSLRKNDRKVYPISYDSTEKLLKHKLIKLMLTVPDFRTQCTTAYLHTDQADWPCPTTTYSWHERQCSGLMNYVFFYIMGMAGCKCIASHGQRWHQHTLSEESRLADVV